jgi:hypothetical protein
MRKENLIADAVGDLEILELLINKMQYKNDAITCSDMELLLAEVQYIRENLQD